MKILILSTIFLGGLALYCREGPPIEHRDQTGLASGPDEMALIMEPELGIYFDTSPSSSFDLVLRGDRVFAEVYTTVEEKRIGKANRRSLLPQHSATWVDLLCRVKQRLRSCR